MKRFVMVTMLAFWGVFVSGCGDDLTSKVIGIWYFHTDYGEHFLEINEKQCLNEGPHGTNKTDIVLNEKDGMVVLRVAGTENTLYTIKIIDDSTIEIDFGFMLYGKQTLKRSSAEARTEGLKKNT